MVTQTPPPPLGWWHRTVAREADRNRLGTAERIGNVIGIFFVLLFFIILIDIQVSGSGFFTDAFGPLEQVLLYGSLLYGVFPSLVRAFTSDRNLGRLADIIGSVIFVAAASYLLWVFPFDVPSLLDYLLGPASEAFPWITNELARAVLLLGIVISIISAAYNVVLYLAVRDELKGRTQGTAPRPGAGPL
jgi:hypothetical protein